MKITMKLRKTMSVLLCVLMLSSLFAPCVSASEDWIDRNNLFTDRMITAESMYHLVGGVTERQVTFNNAAKSNQIKGFVLEVDINDANTYVKAMYNDGNPDNIKRTTVRDQASIFENKFGHNVVAAVNGGRYDTSNGAPAGAFAMNGTVYQGSWNYPYFAILKDGTPVVRYGDVPMDDVAEAVSGMEMLLVNGQFTGVSDNNVHPRTAVGIRADGSLVFFMADGRQQPESCGMIYAELAQTMKALGAVNAMALDGGGSTTVLTQRESSDSLELRNKPSYGTERTVGTSLMICTTAEPTGEFDHVAFSKDKIFCAPNTPVSFEVYGADKYGFRADMPSGGYLELEDTSLGRLSGTTFVSSSKTGTTNINYILDGEVVATLSVEVSGEADDLITQAFKRISQAFANIFNLIRTFFEKIAEKLGMQ